MNKAGNVLNKAKQEIENELKRPIITSQNYVELTKDESLIENRWTYKFLNIIRIRIFKHLKE